MRMTTRLLYLGGSVLVMGSMGFTVWQWTRGSAQGTVRVGSPSNSITSPQNSLRIATTYFSTSLPASFAIKHQQDTPTQAILFSLLAATSSTIDEQIAIRVGTIPTGGMQENADYNLRTANHAMYKQVTLTQLPTGVSAFRSSTELTVFLPHNTRYAQISCSSSGGTSYSTIETLCLGSVNAWEWR